MAPKMNEVSRFLHLFLILMVNVRAEIDEKRYNEGKDQYELMRIRSQMPTYGKCWRDSMALLQEGCGKLTGETQTRLAFAYLSCFLQVQGREALICEPDMDIKDCTHLITESDRSSLSTFFVHTQNMCYFLQAQVWHEETERTVSRLADSSSQVASQLEASHQLQEDILSSQSQSLQNQEMLMNQAYNLKDVINSSRDSVKTLFEDLKLSTQEQGQIMGELFNQLKGLRTTILGEVFGFYSIIYHFLSIIVCYLLTSTNRTSGARFLLFLIVTINIIVEQMLLKVLLLTLWPTQSADGKINDEHLYWFQKQIRRLFLFIGLGLLAVTAYMYQDINSLNNQLLTEIRKQNSDIYRYFSGQRQFLEKDSSSIKENAEISDSDYTSDNSDEIDLDLSDAESDKTFIMTENDNEVSEVESICEGSERERSTLMDELFDLKRSTPVREMQGSPKSWLEKTDPSDQVSSPRQHSYNLRSRPETPSPNTSPALRVESARSFSKTIEHLQRISEKNSRLVRECLKNPSDSSPVSAVSPSPSLMDPLGHQQFPNSHCYPTRQHSATPDRLSVSSRASSFRSGQVRR